MASHLYFDYLTVGPPSLKDMLWVGSLNIQSMANVHSLLEDIPYLFFHEFMSKGKLTLTKSWSIFENISLKPLGLCITFHCEFLFLVLFCF